ncbi:MAG: aldehyde dehydrogenase (NADP(+)) [Candidatus Acidiferrales bacterium]
MELHGYSIIGGEASREGKTTFRGVNPATGAALDPVFYEATEGEINRALALADQAFATYRKMPPEAIARFLDTIATGLENLGPELIARAHAETALPEPRLLGERARTTVQLRMFAALIREGSWLDARIDRANPARTPVPKPDMRRMLLPMGPIVIFGASNFPLAFSVCGGDTASALAAGNTVVVKGHPAHPGTSEMAARVVQDAIRACGMPLGTLSVVNGPSPAVGLALVRHPLARAIGFTGSLGGGRALFDAAAARPVPIPLFAEMGSINPVFVLPGALKSRGAGVAQSMAKSVTLGVGQFCTKPGLALGVRGPELDAFTETLSDEIANSPAATMLHAGIAEHYRRGLSKRRGIAGIRVAGSAAPDSASTSSAPSSERSASAFAAVLTADADLFAKEPSLSDELFGPATLVVPAESKARLEEIARNLAGQLTVTIHATEEDLKEFASLVDILREKAGRLVFGTMPTGLEVGPATQHGGPYPATTDPRFTSVGTAAILRFVRPVCFQDFPQAWLPEELKDENPRKIARMLDGVWTRDPI